VFGVKELVEFERSTLSASIEEALHFKFYYSPPKSCWMELTVIEKKVDLAISYWEK